MLPPPVIAYTKPAAPAVQAEDGRLLSGGGQVVAHEAGIAERTILIEFDIFERALAAYESEAFQKALAALAPADGVERDLRIVEGLD